MFDRVTLDRETFKVLAADTRVEMLKRLGERKLTLTDLAEALELSPSTVKEHLDRLSSAGLIEQIKGDTKWKYYRLTRKGERIIKPDETRVWILLATTLVLLTASVYTLIGLVPEPQLMQTSFARGGGALQEKKMVVSAAEAAGEAGADKGAVDEARPSAASAQPKTPYAAISLVVLFAVLSGALTARIARR